MKQKQLSRILIALLLFSLASSLLTLLPTINADTTLGNSAELTSFVFAPVNQLMLVGPYTANSTGTITAIHIYANTSSTATVWAALYSGNSTLPNALLGEGTAVYITAGTQAWYSLGGFSASVTNGSVYWMGFYSAGETDVGMTAGSGLKIWYAYDSPPFDNPASALGIVWSPIGAVSIYANVTTSFTVSDIAASYRFGFNTTFSANWDTPEVLSHFIFGSNQSGSWVNSTAEAFTSTWSNVTGASVPLDPLLAGTVLTWQVWANTTAGTWSTTELQSVVLEASAPPEVNTNYVLHGVYDETSGALIDACNVTAYFTDAPTQTVEVNGTLAVIYDTQPTHLYFDLSPHSREYWFDPAENTTDIYIYNGNTTSYVINFLDYTGILRSYPYIDVKANVNGSLVTIEKQKVDVQSSIPVSLIMGRRYQINIGGGSTNYVYGDLLATPSTAIQLVIGSVAFPKETLLTQKYIHIYSLRGYGNPYGYITVAFEDTASKTTSVDITIKDVNLTTVYTYTSSVASFTLNWTSATNSTMYYLDVTIHSVYGDLPYRQVFAPQGGSDAPWDLSFLGSLGFNTAYLLPALIILFAAGCFSALNAEVGAILVVIVAVILTWLGWIPIPAGSLVAAAFLAILMALVYNKRRVTMYG